MYKSSPVIYSYVELTVPSFSLSMNDGVALGEVEIRAEEALAVVEEEGECMCCVYPVIQGSENMIGNVIRYSSTR